MEFRRAIRVLLTVPHLSATASPYREMVALAKYLPKDRVALTVCSLRANGYDETEPVLRQLGVSLLVAAFRPKQHSWRGIVRSAREQRKLQQAGPFDIHHSLDFTSSPFEALFARKHRWPYLFSQRNMNEGGHDGLLRAKTRLAAGIIVISDNTQRLMLRIGVPQLKLAKIYNGLDLEEVDRLVQAIPQGQGGYILSVGQLAPRKRHEDAIRALSLLRQRGRALCLRIAGDIYDLDYDRRLRALADELGVGDSVEFLGSRSDVLQLMRQATAVVLCSESEGLPWVLVEAMAVGVPVIGSAIEPCQELLEHGKAGWLVNKGDAEGYANSLCQILQEPTLTATVTAAARGKIQAQFSAPRMAQETLAVYRSLCR